MYLKSMMVMFILNFKVFNIKMKVKKMVVTMLFNAESNSKSNCNVVVNDHMMFI